MISRWITHCVQGTVKRCIFTVERCIFTAKRCIFTVKRCSFIRAVRVEEVRHLDVPVDHPKRSRGDSQALYLYSKALYFTVKRCIFTVKRCIFTVKRCIFTVKRCIFTRAVRVEGVRHIFVPVDHPLRSWGVDQARGFHQTLARHSVQNTRNLPEKKWPAGGRWQLLVISQFSRLGLSPPRPSGIHSRP